MMHAPAPLVRVVDDDEQILQLLVALVTSMKLDVAVFRSAEEFLRSYDARIPGCVISDVRMPGMSGVELQEQLAGQGAPLPFIVMSGDPDVPTVVRAMKNDAIDFLQKPFEPAVLAQRIRTALERDREARELASTEAVMSQKLARLTSREREVLELVVDGRANKQVAHQLDITEKTVEVHRGRLMKKLGALNVVDLVRMVCVGGGAIRGKRAPTAP